MSPNIAHIIIWPSRRYGMVSSVHLSVYPANAHKHRMEAVGNFRFGSICLVYVTETPFWERKFKVTQAHWIFELDTLLLRIVCNEDGF